jgi:hypothetical protein
VLPLAQFWSKSFSKGSNFPLKSERVFRHYLDYYRIDALRHQKWHSAVPLPSSRVWSKSVGNEGAGTVSPCLHYHCTRPTQTSYVALPTHALISLQVWSKSVSNKGHFSLVAETIFAVSELPLYGRSPSSASVVEIGPQRTALYSFGRKKFSSLSRLPLYRATQTLHVALPSHALQPVQVWFTSVST